jgi:SPP1 family phage portal protein
MAVVMNKIPKLLELLAPDQAKATAGVWVAENSTFLKACLDKHSDWLTDAEVEKHQAAYDGFLESVDLREKDRDDGINHKLQVNYAQLVIDTPVDYMLGKPPVWGIAADQDDEKPAQTLLDEYRKDIIKLLRTEEAQRVLSEQLRQGGIAGYSATLAWVDENGKIDYDEFPVNEVVPVFDNRGRLRLLIRYYQLEEDGEDHTATRQKLEIYDGRYITYAVTDETGQQYHLDQDEEATGNPIEHKAARIPGGIFINGTPARHEKRKLRAGTSDLANGVFTLLEALAGTLSDKANTVDRLLDQFLLLTGVDTDKNEVTKMRKSRAIALKSKESGASFLAPSQEDNAVQNYLKDIKDAIHDMTNTPKMNDLQGATAFEVKMKYAGLDIKAGKKEIYFMAALKQMIAVLTDMLNWKRLVEAKVEDPYAVLTGQASSSVPLFKADWLQPTLNRNLPQNYQEIATIVSTLVGKVPDEYLYELLWFIDDPKQALDDMKKQKAAEATASAAALMGGGEFISTAVTGGSGTGTTA